MATINLKVSKARLVDALEKKLAKIKADKANEKSDQEKYTKAVEAWERKVVGSVPKSQKPDDISISNYAYGLVKGKTKVEISYYLDTDTLPEKPKRTVEALTDHDYRIAVEEIESALRILVLSDEETVSTSTYKSVAKYL